LRGRTEARSWSVNPIPERSGGEGASELDIGRRLLDEVLGPLKASFVGKDVIVDLMGLCLLSGENLFLLGPPGTAKSALVHHLGRRLRGHTFEYLLTRFTEPNELFGPFDIRKLREGMLETNTEGMLPEADLVFLDELLNANSAILNSLLTVLNERKLRRGRETLDLPLLMTVGASNHLPEDEALGALFDRFLLRVTSDNVADEHLEQVLDAGWRLHHAPDEPAEPALGLDEIRELRSLLPRVSLTGVRPVYLDLILRLRGLGVEVSDRRAVRLQRLVAASALLCGRLEARASDLWMLRHIWDRTEQQQLLESVVAEVLESNRDETQTQEHHPQVDHEEPPNAEQVAAELEWLRADLQGSTEEAVSAQAWRDRLSVLQDRVEWVENEEQRQELRSRVERLWDELATGVSG